MPHRKRWQYEGQPFVPIHDWVLDCTPGAGGWGNFGWGNVGWGGSSRICTPERMGWLPYLPVFARRLRSRPHLQGGAFAPDPSLYQAEVPLGHISWLPYYPHFARRKQIDMRRLGMVANHPLLNLPDASAVLSQAWKPTFPSYLSRKERQPWTRAGGAFVPSEITPPLTDVAQFPCLHQRYPSSARRHTARPHYYQSHVRRVSDVFGVWTEPGLTPITSGWTEPASSPVTSTWTEPAVSPTTSTWTEPAVTPITPSPDEVG